MNRKAILSLIPNISGKTFIIILLARYVAHGDSHSIFVITRSCFLEAQLD